MTSPCSRCRRPPPAAAAVRNSCRPRSPIVAHSIYSIQGLEPKCRLRLQQIRRRKAHFAPLHRKVHFGGSADPNSCFLLERGMRTLHVRMPKICDNAAELAKRLENHSMIERVNHPTLESHPQYEVAQRIMPRGTGKKEKSTSIHLFSLIAVL